MAFLRCDGPFGDKDIVNGDAIESLKAMEMGDSERPDQGSQHVWDVVVVTATGEHHKYGSYFTEEEAHEVKEQLAYDLEHPGKKDEPRIGAAEERISNWLAARDPGGLVLGPQDDGPHGGHVCDHPAPSTAE